MGPSEWSKPFNICQFLWEIGWSDLQMIWEIENKSNLGNLKTWTSTLISHVPDDAEFECGPGICLIPLRGVSAGKSLTELSALTRTVSKFASTSFRPFSPRTHQIAWIRQTSPKRPDAGESSNFTSRTLYLLKWLNSFGRAGLVLAGKNLRMKPWRAVRN